MTTEAKQGVSSPGAELSRIAFRPPPFWKQNPELWFIQVESSFQISGITSNITKFYSIISALDCDVLQYVVDLIKGPPTEESYDSLKVRIIGHFAETETARLRSLFQDISLGDKRPSQLLHEMQNLASGQMTDDGIRALWLQRLPVHVQQILSVSTEKLDGLAKIADKIAEVSGLATVNVISQDGARSKPCPTDPIGCLAKQVAELTTSVNELLRQRNPNRRNLNRRRSTSRSRNRSSSPSNKGICWYHRTFKAAAIKCVKPCAFQGNS